MVEAYSALFAVPLFCTLSSAAVLCGEETCNAFQYCSEHTFCHDCEDICQATSRNYDEMTCKASCSDYIIEKLYLKRTEFDDVVRGIYSYVAVSLAISIVVLLLILSAFITVWLKYKRMKSYNGGSGKLKKKLESIKAVCKNEVNGPKNLKLEIPVHDAGKVNDTPPSALTTMTPLSRRHPSEDTTLEYAYDNPALTHSPVFGKLTPPPNTTPNTHRTETTF